jgi:hypothetical protein
MAAGVIPLEGCTVQNGLKLTGKKHSIQLSTKERDFFLYADFQVEAEEWMSALTKATHLGSKRVSNASHLQKVRTSQQIEL